MATGVKPLSGGIQNSLPKRLEGLINEFPGFPTLFFALVYRGADVQRCLLANGPETRSARCGQSQCPLTLAVAGTSSRCESAPLQRLDGQTGFLGTA